MKVYAAPDDTALGRKIRNALEAITVDEERLGTRECQSARECQGALDGGLTALVAPGPFAVRYVTLVYLGALERSEAYGRECQSAVASGARALALSSAAALYRARALSIASLRRAGLKVETRDGVVLTVKHDRCHSQINRALGHSRVPEPEDVE